MLFFTKKLMINENILVITDNFEYWIDYFNKIYKITKEVKITSEYILYNQNTRIILKNSINDSARGYRWNKVFIDKNIERELIETVIKPKILTNIYYNQENKNQMD